MQVVDFDRGARPDALRPDRRVPEPGGFEAGAGGPDDVDGRVVAHIDRPVARDAKIVGREGKDCRIGLAQAHCLRHHDDIEQVAEAGRGQLGLLHPVVAVGDDAGQQAVGANCRNSGMGPRLQHGATGIMLPVVLQHLGGADVLDPELFNEGGIELILGYAPVVLKREEALGKHLGPDAVQRRGETAVLVGDEIVNCARTVKQGLVEIEQHGIDHANLHATASAR